MKLFWIIVAWVLLGTNIPGFAADITVKESWNGVIREDGPRAFAPGGGGGGAVTSAEVWEKLWKGWRGAEAVPAVDFAKEVVLVTVVGGPNQARLMGLKTDDKGNVELMAMSTRMAGPGFGYVLARVSREGIKSVNGVALAEVKAATATAPSTAPATGAAGK